jgi:ABC-type transport system involved in multi-copper enzyme maturation permease subunit
MYRTFVIIRHTFFEAIVQPVYSLLLAIGAAVLLIFAVLPFFTLGEDTVMFKAVGLDIVLLLVLISTLFATSRTIFDEIEDRTMLTLMSKPIRKWEVLVGKYIGIILSALMAVAILGVVLIVCLWLRLPGDYQLNTKALDERELGIISGWRWMHTTGLVASLLLTWLQISVLASIGVALSTRFSLVVNLPTVIILYIAGNLTRFMFPLTNDPGAPLAGRSPVVKGLAYVLSVILPYLEAFDLRSITVYSKIKLAGTQFAADPNGVDLSTVWIYLGIAAIYAVCYATFSLAMGMWLFQTRELGGAEG